MTSKVSQLVLSIYERARQCYAKSVKKIILRKLVDQGFPSLMLDPVLFLISGKTDAAVRDCAMKIEKIRKSIASQGQNKIRVLYSPPPKSSGEIITQDLRPQPGKCVEYTMETIAHLGKNQKWGTLLHLCAKSLRAQMILEMGACAGISGCYLATSPYCRNFVTIEGVSSLAQLAEANLRKVTNNAVIVNALFDEGLDRIFSDLKDPIDFAFIDGHHEKVATIHYFQRIQSRLNTPAIVVFDDISWSRDMRDAWDLLAADKGFSHSIDLGSVGVCIWDGATTKPRYWDLQPLVGNVPISDSGVKWSKEAGVTLDGFPESSSISDDLQNR
jgi:predicted O-methyltransferase YrrM